MSTFFEVSNRDIEHLDDFQLTSLLRRLLYLEAGALGIAKAHVDVSLNIKAADGGQDGRLDWVGEPAPSKSNWLPRRVNVFQAKAGEMAPADCGKEVVQTDGTTLKPKVQETVSAAGAYILFYGQSCSDVKMDRRVSVIKETIAACASQTEADAVDIRVYGSEKIAAWTNEYAGAVAFVLRQLNRETPAFCQPWNEWKDEWSGDFEVLREFYLPGSRAANLTQLRNNLSVPRTVSRLVGLSGLGKSRLALEVMRPPHEASTDPQQQTLSDSCIYVSDGAALEGEVVNTVRQMARSGMRGVLVVDECPLVLHDNLARIVASPASHLSILTLDFDPTGDPKSRTCKVFKLEPLTPKEIEELVKASRPDLSDHAAQIAGISQGHPRMVDLLLKAIDSGDERLWNLGRDDIFAKMVIRRSPRGESLLEVARALAVLEHLGVTGDAEYQLGVFQEQLYRSQHPALPLIKELECAGVVYRRGDYVRITPLPLAVWLASGWWHACEDAHAIALLSEDLLPTDQMRQALANQLGRLKGNRSAERLADKALGVNSPFAQREQLNSATGSRLVSSLAEVNPAAVMGALTAAFANLSVDDVRTTVDEARRHIVWTLEKLKWHRETFHDAAYLLMLFGAGENERWSNNSRALFCQLFHVLLSGTEVPAIDRLTVIDVGLSSGDSALVEMAINGLCSGFAARDFMRFGGTEQHVLPKQDWKPSTWGEIHDYWGAILERLLPTLLSENESGERARTRLAHSARGLISWGGISIVEQAVQEVVASGISWPSMLHAARSTLAFDRSKLPLATCGILESIEKRLEPVGLPARLHGIVSVPDWEHRCTDEGSFVDEAEQRAIQLATEISAKPSDLNPYWPLLLMGEQRQGFVFGETLGRNVADPMSIIGTAISSYGVGANNAAVIMGLCAAMSVRNKARLRPVLHAMLKDKETACLASDLIRSTGVDDVDVEALIKALGARAISPQNVGRLGNGQLLASVSLPLTANLARACLEFGPTGLSVALHLIGMQIHGGQPVPHQLQEVVRQLVISRLILEKGAFSYSLSDHHYGMLFSAVQKHPASRSYMTILFRRFLQLATAKERNLPVHEFIEVMLRAHTEMAWNEFQEFASHDGWSQAPWIKLRLADFGIGDPSTDLLHTVGIERLIVWCQQDPKAAHFLASFVHPKSGKSDHRSYPSWGPFAQHLLEHHGSDEHVLDEMSSWIGSGSWTGSAIPRYQSEQAMYREIEHHRVREVRAWAQKHIRALDKVIAITQKREEERDFGIY